MNAPLVLPVEVEVPDTPAQRAADAAERALLEQTWRQPKGLWGWLTEVSHQRLGRRFIITAFVFFALGGLEAAAMRWQLSRPDHPAMGPDLYDQVFTMHGSTMMFLFAVPVMEGMGMYLLPLMLGTRQMAFPRLNAFAYFTYLTGGVLLYASFFLNIGPDAGWFAYTPLSGPEFSPGKRVDIWAQMITFTELSALAGAVNVVVTVFKQRAVGMSLDRVPIFVWAQLVTAFMIIFAMPAVMLCSGMLAMDRLVGTHFFNPAEGGDPLLWQHLFWFFGHPEVYIIFLPGTGMVSALMVPFTRRQLVGYPFVVVSLVATGMIGFGLWVHHMFATGLLQIGAGFFTAASLIIAVPTGVQFFCWIATLATGKPRFRVPFLYVLGFIAIFLIGGLSGVMLGSMPLDIQLHDTYFVVAHLHYVLIGGAVLPLLGGIAYWFPKATGRMLNERAGQIAFALIFIGFNLTFFPMHQLGLKGMTRRIYTYSPEVGWTLLNRLATAGAVLLAAGVLVYVVNALVSARRGAPAGPNPWAAEGLEWSISSPPPPYNFHLLPTVRSRYPLWTQGPEQPPVQGLRARVRETLVTRLVDAEPDHRAVVAGPAISPFLTALAAGVAFIGGLFTPWAFLVGALAAGVSLVSWMWPEPPHHELLGEQP